MHTLSEFVKFVVTLDVIVVAAAFVTGMIVGPIVVLIQRTLRWKQRMKWITVSLFTSWFGLWLFLHRQAGGGRSQANRAPELLR